MKTLLVASCMLLLFIACNSSQTSSELKADTTVAADNNEDVTYAYKPMYADFTIADKSYAKTVLDLWKDYDNNTFDNHKDAFADTVSVDLPGASMTGPRDSIINNIKKYRSSLTSAVSSVEAVVSLKPKGKDETWVCVWGKEVDVYNKKTDSVYLNENWMFNKDGKIAYFSQLTAAPAKPAKK